MLCYHRYKMFPTFKVKRIFTAIAQGVPPGVINIVFGTGPRVGDALVRHRDVKVISFTGSTLTGQKIREAAVTQCKKLSLEVSIQVPNEP